MGASACAAVAVSGVGPVFAQTPGAAPTKPKTERRAAQPRPASSAAKAAPAKPAPSSAKAAAAPAAAPDEAPAMEQSAAPAATVLALKPAQPDWTKICGQHPGGGEICYTTRDYVAEKGQPVLAVAVYDAKGPQPQQFMRFVVPHGLMVQPGIRIAVDEGAPIAGRFAMCLPNGCFAEAVADNDFIDALKTGTNLNVSVRNQTGRVVQFAARIDGFAKSFDGPPIPPQVLQEQQRKVAEEIERRKEEMRKRLASTAAPNADGSATPGTAGDAAQSATDSPAGTAVAAAEPVAVAAKPRRQVTASTLTEKDVIGANGGELGEIARVVETKDAKKRYLIVSRGGVLGFFEHEYAIPLDRVALKEDRVVARDITEDQLAAMSFTDGGTYRTLESGQAIEIAEQQ
jgi:invasion protein IalB